MVHVSMLFGQRLVTRNSTYLSKKTSVVSNANVARYGEREHHDSKLVPLRISGKTDPTLRYLVSLKSSGPVGDLGVNIDLCLGSLVLSYHLTLQPEPQSYSVAVDASPTRTPTVHPCVSPGSWLGPIPDDPSWTVHTDRDLSLRS